MDYHTCNECNQMVRQLKKYTQEPFTVYAQHSIYDITTKALMTITMSGSYYVSIQCYSEDSRDGVIDSVWQQSRSVPAKVLALVITHRQSVKDLVERKRYFDYQEPREHGHSGYSWNHSGAEVRLGLRAMAVFTKDILPPNYWGEDSTRPDYFQPILFRSASRHYSHRGSLRVEQGVLQPALKPQRTARRVSFDSDHSGKKYYANRLRSKSNASTSSDMSQSPKNTRRPRNRHRSRSRASGSEYMRQPSFQTKRKSSWGVKNWRRSEEKAETP